MDRQNSALSWAQMMCTYKRPAANTTRPTSRSKKGDTVTCLAPPVWIWCDGSLLAGEWCMVAVAYTTDPEVHIPLEREVRAGPCAFQYSSAHSVTCLDAQDSRSDKRRHIQHRAKRKRTNRESTERTGLACASRSNMLSCTVSHFLPPSPSNKHMLNRCAQLVNHRAQYSSCSLLSNPAYIRDTS